MESPTTARLAATVMIWALLMAAIVGLSRLYSPVFGSLVAFILLLFTAAGLGLSGFVWNWGRGSNSKQEDPSEAARRSRLTIALRDLSDNELISLRQRMASGEIDNDQLARLLDDSEASKAKHS